MCVYIYICIHIYGYLYVYARVYMYAYVRIIYTYTYLCIADRSTAPNKGPYTQKAWAAEEELAGARSLAVWPRSLRQKPESRNMTAPQRQTKERRNATITHPTSMFRFVGVCCRCGVWVVGACGCTGTSELL